MPAHVCACVSVCKKPRYMRCLGRDAESPRRRTHVRERIKNANILSIYINFKFCLSTQTQEIHIHMVYIHIFVFFCKCCLRRQMASVKQK